MSLRIAHLKEEVETAFNCLAKHVDSTPVIARYKADVTWDNFVETFELTDYPEGKYCYTWFYEVNGERQCVLVLEGPHGVDSPEKAVKLVIASEACHKRTKWWPGMS